MTAKQIDSIIEELQRTQYPVPVSYQIPETPPPFKSPQTKLVKSVLYLGYLIRKAQSKQNDSFLDNLETLTSMMDNLYLLTKFGIGKNSRILGSLSRSASKLWFVTLLLSIKKLLGNIIRLSKLKTNIIVEIRKFEIDRSGLKNYLIQQYKGKISTIKNEILNDVLELIGALNDLFFVSIELFGWNINKRVERIIGFLSAIMSVYRMTKR